MRGLRGRVLRARNALKRGERRPRASVPLLFKHNSLTAVPEDGGTKAAAAPRLLSPHRHTRAFLISYDNLWLFIITRDFRALTSLTEVKSTLEKILPNE